MKVLKVLEKNQIKGTFFISSKLIDETGYLDSQQIRNIKKKGHEIGSHTKTHARLITMDKKKALSELITSKAEIEKIIGHEIFGFSYPFGKFNEMLKALVKLSCYKYARTVKFGAINSPPRDWFEWNPSMIAEGRGGYRKKFFLKYFRFVSSWVFTRGFPRNWIETAHYMFKIIYAKKGFFHLWGHSRSLCQYNDLKKLDKFLLYVSKLPDIWFARNIDIFHYEMTKKYTSIRINEDARKRKEIIIEINPKIEPTVFTIEIEKPNSSLTFKSDHLSIQKSYQGKKLLVTFFPMR